MQSENEQTGGTPISTARPAAEHGYTISKKDRNGAVIDPHGRLVCLTVYKRGAVEVVRRLAA